MGDIEVKGAEDFRALARRLKEAGDKDLRKELYAGINRAVKPIRDDVKANVGNYMPAKYVGKLSGDLRLTTSKRTSASNPGVAIRAKAKKRRVDLINAGKLSHPLYGNRKHWYTTTIKPGFFTSEAQKGARKAQDEIRKSMDAVAAKVAKK